MKFELPSGAEYILSRLNAAGYKADIVGGCVRDTLIGRIPDDFDITTNALPSETKTVFADDKTIDTGIKHGTVTVIKDGKPYEVTTYRIDGDYKDSRHPSEVYFAEGIDADLSRRDFTVNAMAYNHHDGITDLHGGMQDLSARIIRAVGDPEVRFSEDALRILRAIRFASVLGFRVEEKTAAAVHSLAYTLSAISRERILTELRKLIGGKDAYPILMEYSDVIEKVAPELRGMTLPERELFDPLGFAERMACMFAASSGKEGWLATAKELKLDNKTRDLIKGIIDAIVPSPITDESDVGEYLVGKSDEILNSALAVSLALGYISTRDAEVIRSVAAMPIPRTLRELKIGGAELNGIGIRGERTGRVLACILRMVARGEIPNERETLLLKSREIL